MRNPDLDAALQKVDTATNALADNAGNLATAVDGVSTRVAALIDKINSRMTDAEVAAVKDTLNSETDRLDVVSSALGAVQQTLSGIASDSSNPVPDTPPVPEPTPEPTPEPGPTP